MATLTLPLRTLHVLGVAVLVGAATALWYGFRPAAAGENADSSLFRLARAYEWAFWAIVAVVIVTGIGNVAAYGRGIPGPTTEWGLVLTAKLVAIVGLLVLSVLRSLLVDRASSRDSIEGNASGQRARSVAGSFLARRLGRGYALTALYLAGVVVLAEVLAHG
jgi:uncharacterized membrane protein